MHTTTKKFMPLLLSAVLLASMSSACNAVSLRGKASPSISATNTAQETQPSSAPVLTVSPQSSYQPTATVPIMVGPVPYPTPQTKITAWEQLINQDISQNISWTRYEGEIQSNEKGILWAYTFVYPLEWYLTANPNPMYVSVQSIPESNEPPKGDFVKFEVLRLKAPPMLENGLSNPQDTKTVTIAGERGVLVMLDNSPGRARDLDIVFQHQEVWFAVTGYITLSTENTENLERDTAILLSMAASLQFRSGP